MIFKKYNRIVETREINLFIYWLLLDIRELYELLQAAGAGVDSGPGYVDTANLYAARQQRKALAPSLRLRFGKRDNEIEDVCSTMFLLYLINQHR